MPSLIYFGKNDKQEWLTGQIAISTLRKLEIIFFLVPFSSKSDISEHYVFLCVEYEKEWRRRRRCAVVGPEWQNCDKFRPRFKSVSLLRTTRICPINIEQGSWLFRIQKRSVCHQVYDWLLRPPTISVLRQKQRTVGTNKKAENGLFLVLASTWERKRRFERHEVKTASIYQQNDASKKIACEMLASKYLTTLVPTKM